MFFMALDFFWPLFTFIIVIFFPELQCEQPETPSNSVNYQCYVSLGYCTYACKTTKKLFKNQYFITCDPRTLQWGEIPDCVGKQLLLLLFLLFWVVSTFTNPATKFKYGGQRRTQSLLSPWTGNGKRTTLERSDLRSENTHA